MNTENRLKTGRVKWGAAALVCTLAALLLEMIPKGIVLRFGLQGGRYYIQHFTYFSDIPYGYAFVFPLLTGIATVLLLIFGLAAIIWSRSRKIGKLTAQTSVAAFVLALLVLVPFFESLNGITVSVAVLLGIACLGLRRSMQLLKGEDAEKENAAG